MEATTFFSAEIFTELIRVLYQVSQKSLMCKETAVQMLQDIQELYPIIQEIQYSGVELPQYRQQQISQLIETMREGMELSNKVARSGRWNLYKNIQKAKKLEKIQKKISRFVENRLLAHIFADVHHTRVGLSEGFDKMDHSVGSLQRMVGEMTIGGGGWVQEAVYRREEVEMEVGFDFGGGVGGGFKVGLEVGKRKVKEMLMERDDCLVGIRGIGGSGKTTLANEICRDEQVKEYFDNGILFLTVLQSPNLESLKLKISNHLRGNSVFRLGIAQMTTGKSLIVLDDVWKESDLRQLICEATGLKFLVVSRFKFPRVLSMTYEVELLWEHDAMMLFCYHAFGQKSIPVGADEKLVKQIVRECEGLPLALKVIGSSLRNQPEMYWSSASKKLSRGEPIDDSHESNLLERMAISVQQLSKKVKECFLDLGAFPKDMKIPADVLINMWMEIHDIELEEAFAILVELSDKNLLTLVKDYRVGEMYASYYEVSVTRHDVLRDLALHLNNKEETNDCRHLLLLRRESVLPREWEKNSDEPFKALIVSAHTDEVGEMDWPSLHFPKAKVLILNFSANNYYLPPFIDNMPKLGALIVINHSPCNAVLRNFEVFNNLKNLRSLWLERVCVPQLSNTTKPLNNMKKISLILCKIGNSLGPSLLDLPHIFPRLSELIIDHCDDLVKLPESICRMYTLTSLSITNCHSLYDLPAYLGKLSCLEILRLYACPNLKALPPSICELGCLKYLDISQCFNLSCLPEGIGRLSGLEKIDMRECSQIRGLPASASSMRSLRRVICDDEVYWYWQAVKKALPSLNVQVAEKCVTLERLDD